MYSLSNLLANCLRGCSLGASVMLLLLSLLLLLISNASTSFVALTVAISTISQQAIAIAWDMNLIQNCMLKVKLVYSLFYVAQCSFWYFQGNIAVTLLPASSLYIYFAFIARNGVAIYTLTQYTAVLSDNSTCSTRLDLVSTILEKAAELGYSLLVASLIILQLSKWQRNQVGSGQLASKILHDQAFIQVLVFLFNLVHACVVFTSQNAFTLSIFNNLLAVSYVVYMMLYLVTPITSKIVKERAAASLSGTRRESVIGGERRRSEVLGGAKGSSSNTI